MVLIVDQDTNDSFLYTSGYGVASLDLSHRTGAAIQPIQGTSQATFNPSLISSIGNLIANGVGSVDAFIRKNSEANVFPSFNASCNSNASLGLSYSYDFSMLSAGVGSTSLDFILIGNEEANRLRFHLEAKAVPVLNRFRQYAVKVSVDGVKLGIKQFNWTRSSLAMSFSCTLANLAQRSLVEGGTSFKFEVATIKGGVTTWRTLFDASRRQSSTYSVGWSETSPTDTFSFTVQSDLANRLNKTPLKDTVIYDPARTKVNATDYEPYYDTTGHAITAELKSVGGLKLHYLLNEILVTRCGFAAVKTNIPDTPIRRLECPMTRTYWESLKGLLGMYRLAIKQIGNTIWILDKTLAAPVGFPAPRTVTTTNYKQFTRTKNNSKVEALRLIYQVNDTEAMFGVQHERTEGDSITSNGTYTDITETSWYSTAFPTLLVTKTLDESVSHTIVNGTEVLVVTERYTYNSAKRVTNVKRDVELYLPAIVGGAIRVASGYALSSAESHNQSYEYSSHPYIPFGEYLREIITESSGLIAVNSTDKYLNQDFRQAILEAHKAGNLKDGMAIDSGTYQTKTETFSPQPDGSVQHTVRFTNYLRNVAEMPESANKTGETYLPPNGGATKKLLVMKYDTSIRSGDEVEEFTTGELPLYQALPLARRELLFRQTKSGEINSTVLGIDLDLDDGTAVALSTRSGESQGNAMINSVSLSGTNLGTPDQELTQTIQADPI